MLLFQPGEEQRVIAKKDGSGGAEATTERWLNHLGDLHARIARRFRRPEVGQRARRYLLGLLERVDRKNGYPTRASGLEDTN